MATATQNQKPDPQPNRKRWLLPLFIVIVLAAGSGTTAYLFRSNIKHKVWTWRAQEQLKEARQWIQSGEWSRAHSLALTANRLDPSSLEVLRVLFQTATHTNSPHAPQIATNLFLHPGCPIEEKVNLLSYFDLSRNDRHFMALFDQLSEEQRQLPDARFLHIRFLAARGGHIAARQMLNEYFSTGRTEQRFRGLQARILLLSSDPQDREQGQKIVASLMEDSSEVSQQAFGLLWDVPPAFLQPSLFPAHLDEWVAGLPHPGTKEMLVAAQLELAKVRDEAGKQEEIFQRAVTQFGSSDPETLCAWLLRFQRYDLILSVVDEAKGRSSLILYDQRLRALAAVQGIEAAEAWLDHPHPSASPIQICLSRAKLAHLRKDRPQEQKFWKEAFSIAEVDQTYRQYLPIFRAALELRQWDTASRALLAAAPYSAASFPSSLEIQPIIAYLYGQDRLRDLSIISQRLLQSEPQNVVLRNNLLYIALVLGQPLENSTALARELVDRYPKILGLRTTLALALLRDGQSREALPILESSEVEWSTASPADLAIHALVLEDCGEAARAEQIRQQINRQGLTGTERRAFATVFRDEATSQDPGALFADIRAWMIQGGHKYARQLLEEYFDTGGTERRFLALYAELLLYLHYAENDPLRGQEIVAQLMEQPDEHARRCFALLAQFPAELIRPSAFPENLREWVKGLPGAGLAEAIAAAKVDYLRAPDPPAREEILTSLMATHGKSAPASIAALLAELDRFDLVLALVAEPAALSSAALRDLRLEALLQVEGPDAAQRWLESTRGTDDTPAAWLSTARLRHGLHDDAGTLAAFREASSLAQRDQITNHFLPIYETALELGHTPMAIRALLSASLHPHGGIPSAASLTPILTKLYAEDRLDDLYTLVRTLLRQEPENDSLRILEAYLSVILRDPTSRALDVTRDLVERHPGILGVRTTRALALTVAEEFEDALQVLPREPEPWNHASPVDLAIYTLVLENARQFAPAAEFRARFDPDDLTPTERRAIAAAKRKSPSSQTPP